jgi:hypothetical protein
MLLAIAIWGLHGTQKATSAFELMAFRVIRQLAILII